MRSPLSPWYHNLQQRCEEAEAILEKLSPEPPLQPVWKLRQQLYDLYDMYWDEASARHEELKESQLALQAALDKYVALYDFAPVGYLTLDDNGAILEANLTVARLLGIDRRDLIGQLLYAYLPDRENKDAFYLHCNRAMATGRLEGCDVTIQRRDGTQLIARLDSCFNARQHLLHTALSDVTARCQIEAELQAARDEGEVLRAAHDALERQVLDRTEALQRANAQLEREIAERKGLEAQVLQAEKMQAVGSLAGGIAHEFNNVLSVIMGYTDLLQDEVRYHPTALEYAQEVQQASQRLQEFVQQILAYSRSDSVASEPAPLSEVVNDILGFLRRSLPATIELGAYIEAEVQSASVRRTPLFQVLMNLCSNAEHAMRDAGGRLIIDAAASHVDAAFAARHPPLRPGSHVRITVRDTGMGIEPEMLPRIFDPFFTTKEVGEGTGMGWPLRMGLSPNKRERSRSRAPPARGRRLPSICRNSMRPRRSRLGLRRSRLRMMLRRPSRRRLDASSLSMTKRRSCAPPRACWRAMVTTWLPPPAAWRR